MKEPRSLFLSESLPVDYVFKQFTSPCILHHEIQLSLGFDDLVQLDHMGVPHNLQNVDFACNPLNVTHVSYLVLLEYLHSDFFSRKCVRAYFDFAKSAFSKISAYCMG